MILFANCLTKVAILYLFACVSNNRCSEINSLVIIRDFWGYFGLRKYFLLYKPSILSYCKTRLLKENSVFTRKRRFRCKLSVFLIKTVKTCQNMIFEVLSFSVSNIYLSLPFYNIYSIYLKL